MALELETTNTLESQGEKWRLAVKKPTSRRGCFLSVCFSLTEDSTLKPGFLHQASTSREFHGRREANRKHGQKKITSCWLGRPGLTAFTLSCLRVWCGTSHMGPCFDSSSLLSQRPLQKQCTTWCMSLQNITLRWNHSAVKSQCCSHQSRCPKCSLLTPSGLSLQLHFISPLTVLCFPWSTYCELLSQALCCAFLCCHYLCPVSFPTLDPLLLVLTICVLPVSSSEQGWADLASSFYHPLHMC